MPWVGGEPFFFGSAEPAWMKGPEHDPKLFQFRARGCQYHEYRTAMERVRPACGSPARRGAEALR